MSAKVEILVDHLYDVTIVPVQVVANRGGRKVCYIENGGTPEEREVETGAFNDIFVQIVKGVNVGETVLLNPPRNLEPKTESATATVTAMAGR
jgi:multidrug efflux pump subunit AcrA (membrane-fusion protein)